ncbi:MAG: aminotransferase class I/II-fold pyridoxal phosphate-dependent enzyme [Erythrobacter sp.]
MTDPLRALVAPFAVHGGRSDLARAAFGSADWLDLSTGISPWAFSPDIPAEALAALPSPQDLALLEARAAACFGSDPASTVALAGSDLGLRLIGQLLASSQPAAVAPGYSGHIAMWPSAPQQVCSDAQALLAAGDAADALVLARPGNPGGEIASEAILHEAALRLATRGGWLIVDEAFADADPAISLAGRDWPNLVVMRSFGKFAGLAGLRLGFVIAPPSLARRLRQLIGDWPVGGPAIAAGTALYTDTAWQAAQRARLEAAGAGLDHALAKAGIPITAATPFFRTCRVTDAWALFDHLARRAILTRPFADDRTRLRLGLPADDAAARRLAAALSEWSL